MQIAKLSKVELKSRRMDIDKSPESTAINKSSVTLISAVSHAVKWIIGRNCSEKLLLSINSEFSINTETNTLFSGIFWCLSQYLVLLISLSN